MESAAGNLHPAPSGCRGRKRARHEATPDAVDDSSSYKKIKVEHAIENADAENWHRVEDQQEVAIKLEPDVEEDYHRAEVKWSHVQPTDISFATDTTSMAGSELLHGDIEPKIKIEPDSHDRKVTKALASDSHETSPHVRAGVVARDSKHGTKREEYQDGNLPDTNPQYPSFPGNQIKVQPSEPEIKKDFDAATSNIKTEADAEDASDLNEGAKQPVLKGYNPMTPNPYKMTTNAYVLSAVSIEEPVQVKCRRCDRVFGDDDKPFESTLAPFKNIYICRETNKCPGCDAERKKGWKGSSTLIPTDGRPYCTLSSLKAANNRRGKPYKRALVACERCREKPARSRCSGGPQCTNCTKDNVVCSLMTQREDGIPIKRCNECREQNKKCPGGQPCKSCKTRGLKCVYDNTTRFLKDETGGNMTLSRTRHIDTARDML